MLAITHRDRTLWWLLPFVLLVTVGSVGASHDRPAGQQAAATLLGLIAAAASTLAIPRPDEGMMLNGAAVGSYFALGLGNGPIFLTVPAVAFVAGRHPWGRWRATLLGACLLLILIGLTLRVSLHDGSAFLSFWQAIGLAALSLAAVTFARSMLARRAVRAEVVRRTATEEQLRMAQDLHDGVGHGLAVIAMQAGVALHLLDKPDLDHDSLRRGLTAIQATSRESLDALRAELAVMSAPQSLPRRPAPGLRDLNALLSRVRAGGLQVERSGEAGSVPDAVGHVAYAVVQEALTNVLRHADATRASVVLARHGPNLLLTITDNGGGTGPAKPVIQSTQVQGARVQGPEVRGTGVQGTGFEGKRVESAGCEGTRIDGTRIEATGVKGGDIRGMGIQGMRDRVERLGGVFEIHSGTGGFEVSARLPVPP